MPNNFICENCKTYFTSKKKNIRFCSNRCRATKINNLLIDGKSKRRIENKIYNCKTCGKRLHSQTKTGYCREHFITTEYKELLSKRAIDAGNGGYKKGSGQGKSGRYMGYWCDSSWELAWVIYNLDHDIKIKRNKKGFKYIYKNESYTYYPDFILDDCYIEIKGWMNEKTKNKIEQFPEKIKVLFRKDLEHIFEYVHNKYGKDFTSLYESK